MSSISAKVTWPAAVHEIVTGDQAVALASVTPARGVVVAPVTNFATCDRDGGTITVNSSVGAPRKLERIRSNPAVALAFHTRAHGASERPEYLLVQGRATLSEPVSDYPATIGERWDHAAGPQPSGPIWDRWLRIYRLRVGIEITVERVVVWPDLACEGGPAVHGPALPPDPPSHASPARGTEPRVSPRRITRRAAGIPDVLLGWAGADGLPMVVPVELRAAGHDGIDLHARHGLVPPGARRAGLTAHRFTRYVLGQHQHVMTGWLEAASHGMRYSPHTHYGYRLPPSETLYHLVVGFETRRRYRAALRRDV